jgi:GTP-binding protein
MAIPKIVSAEFSLSAHRVAQFPRGDLPEVAFLGRSNVGKSFLINGRWRFVDLPGFGYAAVSRALKESWGHLVLEYLGARPNVAAVVFLQDGRRRLGPEELFLWEFLTARGRAVLPVLTKADKLKMGERARHLEHLAGALAPFGVTADDLTWFSARTFEGRDELWSRLLTCLGGP